MSNIDLKDYLNENLIIIDNKYRNKKSVLSFILDEIIKNGIIKKSDKRKLLNALIKREEMGSTGIGGGIALPHVRTDMVKSMVLCVYISETGVDFNSIDQSPVQIIILLLSPTQEAGLHLKMLAFLARMLRDKNFVSTIKNMRDKKELIEIFLKHQFWVQ